MQERKPDICHAIALALLVCYMLFLTWVILFKLQFSLRAIDRARALNLVPFHYEDSDNPGFRFKEVMDNVLIFIPLGIYLSMLWKNMKLMTKAGIIIAVSLSFEILQCILHIGVSDITDLLTNTAGGLIGIGIFHLTLKLLKSEEKATRAFIAISGIAAALIIGGLSLLFVMN